MLKVGDKVNVQSCEGVRTIERIIQWDATANERLRYDERCTEEDFPQYVVSGDRRAFCHVYVRRYLKSVPGWHPNGATLTHDDLPGSSLPSCFYSAKELDRFLKDNGLSRSGCRLNGHQISE